MKNILVTGAAGFIGANFAELMVKKYEGKYNIIVFDKLTYAGNLGTIKNEIEDSRVEFVLGDICDKEKVTEIFTKHDIDYVVNFAAESHVDRSITNPQLFLETNILGTQNMLECAKQAWTTGKDSKGYPTYKEGKKYLQVSTDEVYGTLTKDFDLPEPLTITDDQVKQVVKGRENLKTYGKEFFTEETPLDPRSPYSASKTGADLISGCTTKSGLSMCTGTSSTNNMIQEETAFDFEFFQSNHEGAIVDKIQEAYLNKVDGIVINPAAYTHTSVAILDALKSVNIPCVEVHISDISTREEFRKHSYISLVAEKTIKGHGFNGYIEAIDYLINK